MCTVNNTVSLTLSPCSHPHFSLSLPLSFFSPDEFPVPVLISAVCSQVKWKPEQPSDVWREALRRRVRVELEREIIIYDRISSLLWWPRGLAYAQRDSDQSKVGFVLRPATARSYPWTSYPGGPPPDVRHFCIAFPSQIFVASWTNTIFIIPSSFPRAPSPEAQDPSDPCFLFTHFP